jgi:hypothetical protein
VPVLAFTGYDAFPVMLVGALLLTAGLLLRRRSRPRWTAATMALSLPEVPATPVAASVPPSARSERAAKLLVGALMLAALLRRGRP